MKLHFEADLPHQQQAIDAVCALFSGQEICQGVFSVNALPQGQLALGEPDAPAPAAHQGVGNRLSLLDDEWGNNLHTVQLSNGLAPSENFSYGPTKNSNGPDFTVEMETGTGKTYVYLRTIFELNKRYGFTKFAIVVPSVAIKEGVYKTLQITQAHFKSLYSGVPYSYFLYDSSKPGDVRSFATSANIQIMVMTVGAINKKEVNNLYKVSEKTGGDKPIDLIKQTRPIVIVDEPQSVDGGLKGAGKEALSAMHPLCTLRYSATHVDKHHMVYCLDAVQAYEQKLVKQIEVAAATVEDAHNKPYVRLLKVTNKRGAISASVEVDVAGAAGKVQRKAQIVYDGDDLEQITKRAVYAGLQIGEIHSAKGKEALLLRWPGHEMRLLQGEAHGDIDPALLHRHMIRRTIREHLDKELRLRPQGIKVLSLFFIDAVDKYRQYDSAGQPVQGPYAQMFEEEYRHAATLAKYQSLFSEIDWRHAANEVHNGYFSIDKKGGWADTPEGEGNASSRENAERAYNLIMRDKETLLSLNTPLKFIFSHSALREGWDNPNVFQICNLREMSSERQRRQTIGRGLRLCVNQAGVRVRDPAINVLTVIATESYESFAENLQKEISDETGVKFGIVAAHQLAALSGRNAAGELVALGMDAAQRLWQHLTQVGYLSASGEVQDNLKNALHDNNVQLPEEFAAQQAQIHALLHKAAGKLEIKNADERVAVALRRDQNGKAVYLSADFKALWDRIKHHTLYQVEFDNAKLIQECVKAVDTMPLIAKSRLQWRKAQMAIDVGGVTATEQAGEQTLVMSELNIAIPDVLTELQDRTQLTRRSLVAILTQSPRLQDLAANPQQFIKLVSEAINITKHHALVDGIKYQRLGEQYVYAQELFAEQELSGYLKNTLQNAQKSVFEHVIYDSEVEREFADRMEKNDLIKLYVKLPGWFKIPTPLGNYNPDWAVLLENDGQERLYFVVETKGTLFKEGLRLTEQQKIECGERHFEAIAAIHDNPARYAMTDTLDNLLKKMQ
ncbi:MAG: type III restriction-modification system endonuclease [Aeromonas sp.]